MTPHDLLLIVQAEPIDIDRLDHELNATDHPTRIGFLRLLTPKHQRRLFDAAKGRTVTLGDIVPAGVGKMSEVIHEGQNTLPAFRAFQKRFCTPDITTAREELWGYNHQAMAGFTGPGYFVAYDDTELGEVVIDYKELPPKKPESWPPILSNSAKLGRFVYAGMVDRLRRVSDDVSIGRAYKKKPMSAWFTLVRVRP